MDLDSRLAFARDIAVQAGRRLVALRASGRWSEAKIVGDIGDQAADGFLQGALLARHPADAVLSEETKDDLRRTDNPFAWIVDPLDGTREYSTGRHDWAVHVGLAVDGEPVLGAVALPAIGRVLLAARGAPTRIESTVAAAVAPGEWPTTIAAEPAADAPLRLAASRSHTPDWMQRFAANLGGAQLVPSGSVGFKVALLLLGSADVYVHKIGLKEWDTCAPEAVARAAGFAVCRFDGTSHRYNQPDPRNDELVVCRPALLDRVLAGLRASGA
ncbi:MAG: 3'(2'),5'-bisphosphate nucleotidase CysQ [Planctomycetota bacterium]